MQNTSQALQQLSLLHRTITLHTVFGVTPDARKHCYRSPMNWRALGLKRWQRRSGKSTSKLKNCSKTLGLASV